MNKDENTNKWCLMGLQRSNKLNKPARQIHQGKAKEIAAKKRNNKLCEQLYTGVYLKPNKLKYFVDKKSNKNCFVLFARELDICWNENPQYWRWTTLKETRGQFNGAIDLSPGIVYEIVFVVRMIKYEDFSLKLTIILPNSKKRTRNESLNEKPLGSWFDIQLGEFKMSPENVGTMEFSLEDHAELWKSGLIEKCAIIRPKKEPEDVNMVPNGASEIQQVEQTSKADSSRKAKEIAARKGITRPPLSFLAILKDANISIDMSSPDKLCEQLYSGVYLKPNKLKYFVDKKSNKNCFVLFARELNSCWNDNPQYCRWTTLKETSGEEIEVAELLQVCWLDVRGQFNGAIDLSSGIVYEIVFVVRMIKYEDFSLKLTIILPNSKKLTRNESLNEKPLGSWFDIQLGEFKMSPENVGTMEFSLEDHTELWKSGLIVKCAIIRPKKEPE
ncbi:unnamed protein product [Camellia sinensis]